WSCPGGRSRQMDLECTSGVRRSIHREPAPVSCHRHGRGGPGQIARRYRQVARGSRQGRRREQLRGLRGNTYQRRRCPFPKPCDAVFQQESVLQGRLPVTRSAWLRGPSIALISSVQLKEPMAGCVRTAFAGSELRLDRLSSRRGQREKIPFPRLSK